MCTWRFILINSVAWEKFSRDFPGKNFYRKRSMPSGSPFWWQSRKRRLFWGSSKGSRFTSVFLAWWRIDHSHPSSTRWLPVTEFPWSCNLYPLVSSGSRKGSYYCWAWKILRKWCAQKDQWGSMLENVQQGSEAVLLGARKMQKLWYSRQDVILSGNQWWAGWQTIQKLLLLSKFFRGYCTDSIQERQE